MPHFGGGSWSAQLFHPLCDDIMASLIFGGNKNMNENNTGMNDIHMMTVMMTMLTSYSNINGGR